MDNRRMFLRSFSWFHAVCALAVYAETPAFPGAEGFGSATHGGRGGAAVFVRNLNDSGPGSFREACEIKGPRMVMFRVSGIIDLRRAVKITEPYITIAGQSAPGGGICLRSSGLEIETHDVVVRFLRSRPGDVSGKEVDSIAIGGESRDIVIDHCSASWSVDEALSPSGGIRDVTVQWSIISEGLNKSVHHKGGHGYGSLARAVGGITFHHNLWAHNNARNPRLGDNYGKPPFPIFDLRNNVMYDYGSTCSGLTGDVLSANYVANYIKPGPSSNQKQPPIVFTETAKTRYYIGRNVVEGHPDWTANNHKMFNRAEAVTIMPEPFDAPRVTTTTAGAALLAVLESAGACLPARDAVDARIVAEVREGRGSLIDSQWEVGGWPEYRLGRPPMDLDRDGIADAWEKARGLDPRKAADASADRDGDGYTNLEEYLNELAKPKPVRKPGTSVPR